MIITEKHCFYPDSFEYSTPDQFNLKFSELKIRGEDGFLTGWHILPSEDADDRRKTILHLHGNAQNMSAHLYGSYFIAKEGFRLITFDYRGYGMSQGAPSLQGIIDDAKTFIDYLLKNPFEPDEPLALFGQSMGAFTTAHILPEFPELDGAVMEAGLISFRQLFTEAYPEAENIVPGGFSTLVPLKKSATPKLFIHGTADSVVPVSHSIRMHEEAKAPKELLILDGVGHIDALNGKHAVKYVDRIIDFLS